MARGLGELVIPHVAKRSSGLGAWPCRAGLGEPSSRVQPEIQRIVGMMI
jgi:hypothetical protein